MPVHPADLGALCLSFSYFQSLVVVLLAWRRGTCFPPSLLTFLPSPSSVSPPCPLPFILPAPPFSFLAVCWIPSATYAEHTLLPQLFSQPPPPLQVPFICQRLSWMSLACIKCDLPGTGPVTCVCCGLTVASQYPPACVVPELAGSKVSSSSSTFPCCPLSLCGLCSRDRGRSCGPEASSLRI